MPTFLAPALAFLVLLGGCGQQNSYEAAEAALRDWLTAVHASEGRACDLMTAGYRRDLVRAGEHDTAAICEEGLSEMASDASPSLPPADSDIQVAVWDPSGKALVEVTNPGSEGVERYWMQYENNLWLVAGQER